MIKANNVHFCISLFTCLSLLLVVSSIDLSAQTVCGDIDGFSDIDIGDLVYMVEYQFLEGPFPQPELCAADIDGVTGVDIADIVWMVEFQFLEGPPIDQNCCGDAINYSGTFLISPEIDYECAFGAYAIYIYYVVVSDNGNEIVIDAGEEEGFIMGDFSTRPVFNLNLTVDGICSEFYHLSGTFIDADTFEATITVNLDGQCGDCTLQSWDIIGTRYK